MKRIPVESGQLTSYLRQDAGLWEWSVGSAQESSILIILQAIFFVLVKFSSNELTNSLFCWASFPAGSSFSCLEKESKPWGRGCIGVSLGTLDPTTSDANENVV